MLPRPPPPNNIVLVYIIGARSLANGVCLIGCDWLGTAFLQHHGFTQGYVARILFLGPLSVVLCRILPVAFIYFCVVLFCFCTVLVCCASYPVGAVLSTFSGHFVLRAALLLKVMRQELLSLSSQKQEIEKLLADTESKLQLL